MGRTEDIVLIFFNINKMFAGKILKTRYNIVEGNFVEFDVSAQKGCKA